MILALVVVRNSKRITLNKFKLKKEIIIIIKDNNKTIYRLLILFDYLA
jgi:hypothetical protein